MLWIECLDLYGNKITVNMNSINYFKAYKDGKTEGTIIYFTDDTDIKVTGTYEGFKNAVGYSYNRELPCEYEQDMVR